jgi:hypothetical protein
MWQKIGEDQALLRGAKINDYLFCSVYEDGIQRDTHLSQLYLIAEVLPCSFVLLSLGAGTFTIKTFEDFDHYHCWLLSHPALSGSIAGVPPRAIRRPAMRIPCAKSSTLLASVTRPAIRNLTQQIQNRVTTDAAPAGRFVRTLYSLLRASFSNLMKLRCRHL